MQTAHRRNPRLLTYSPGSHRGDFQTRHWLLLAATSVIFGSAYLWIALALRSLAPSVIAFGRVSLGAAAIAVLPAARTRVRRSDVRRIAAAGLAGHAVPALMFAMAEQHIDSAVAGMLVSSVPLVTAGLTVALTGSMPTRRRRTGLAIGCVGVVLLAMPELTGSAFDVLGVALVLVAVVGYSVAAHLYVPLQHEYGSLPVVMWSLFVAALLLAPLGAFGLATSAPEPLPIVALLILGVLGTGIVRAMSVSLMGKVGATRGSILGYTIPIVALTLGVLVLDESVAIIQIIGVGIALAGGYLVSKQPGKETPT